MNAGILHRLAERVADGSAIDWPASADDPRIAGLRKIELLADAFRNAEHRTQQRDPLFTWRHLEVLERIGAGSFGEVFRAWDPVLAREVALKLIDTGDRQALGKELIAAEARRMGRLRHPAILAVHGADEQDGRLGIWSDLLAGRTLDVILAENGRLPPAVVLELALPLCDALLAVHRKALTHGDFKPANIMIQNTGSPVLIDFGAAREVLIETVTAGTPRVMAPETFEGGRASPAADMYAFGAVMYRMLSGRYPINAEGLAQLQAGAHRKHRPDMSVVPRLWRPLLARLLALSPSERPNAAAALDQLRYLQTAGQRRRRRAVVAAIGASLILGLVIASLAWREAASERDRAETAAATLLDVLKSPRPSRSGRNMRALDLLHDMRPQVQALLPGQSYLRARVMLELADTFLYFDEFGSVRELGTAALAACADCTADQRALLQLRRHHQLTEMNLIAREMQDAEAHARAALAIAKRLHAPDSAQYAYAMARVGDVLLARRQMEEAGPLLRRSLDLARAAQWDDLEELAFIRGTWLTWLTSSGTMPEAEDWAREQIVWTEANFGLRHSATLSAHQGLNRILIQTSQLEEAARRLADDIELSTDWLGATDTTTLGLRLQQASLLGEQGQRDESIRELEAVRGEILAGEFPDQEALLVASGNLANRYKDAERYDKAERMYAWVIDKTTRSLGPEHSKVLLNRANLAELWLIRGDAEKALIESQDIERTAIKTLGERHLITQFVRMITGRSHTALGRHEQAWETLAQARAGLAELLGVDAALTMRAEFHYASALAADGRADEALDQLGSLKPRMIEQLGSDHEHVRELTRLLQDLN